MNLLRIIVCGGRGYDPRKVFQWLDANIDPSKVALLAQGGATGADQGALDWSEARLTPDCRLTVRAEWHIHGNKAGPIRNRRLFLLARPNTLIAFPGEDGTADMVDLIKQVNASRNYLPQVAIIYPLDTPLPVPYVPAVQ